MQLHRMAAVVLLSTAGLWAADRVSAYRAQLNGPSGPINGTLVSVGNDLIFVNPTAPDQSFAIPRSDVQTLTVTNTGLVTAQVSRPFNGPYGQTNTLAVQMNNPTDAGSIVQWIGVPLTNETPVAGNASATREVATTTMFNVTHNGDDGRLVVGPNGISFEDVSNRSNSRTWAYSDLKGVDRKGNNEVIIRPYNGDEQKFKTNELMSDAIYNAIANNILAARPQ